MRDDAIVRFPRSSLCVFGQCLREYGFESLPTLERPTVLDVGANVGAFALYALERWPGAVVHCYEPHPETFGMLAANVEGLSVRCVNAAVVHPKMARTAPLYEGKGARTECSLRADVRWPHVSQDLERTVDVELRDAADLPPADVVKVDTEGSEVEILRGYRHLGGVRVLLVECHAVGGDLAGQVREVVRLARAAGLEVLDRRAATLRFLRAPGGSPR